MWRPKYEEEPEPELPAADKPETAEAEETAEVLPEDEADEPEMTEETAEPDKVLTGRQNCEKTGRGHFELGVE